MKDKIICAVTGKGINEIGNGKSETCYKNVDVKRNLVEKLSALIAEGVTDFLCNAEYGMPLWAAEILLALRDNLIQQGLEAFRLHIVCPYEEQASDWSDDVHERFYQVHGRSDAVLLLYRLYHDKCYENSERFMIDQCDFLFTDDQYAFAAQYAEIHDKPLVLCKELERI